MKTYTFAPILKWHRIKNRSCKQIFERVHKIANQPPPHVPRILNYGLTDDRIRIETVRLTGATMSLHNSHHYQSNIAFKSWFRESCYQALTDWRQSGFVHGDISPRNILIETLHHPPHWRLWFIDWTLDLASFEGTPQYCSPDVLDGKRNHDTDLYAITTILKSWSEA